MSIPPQTASRNVLRRFVACTSLLLMFTAGCGGNAEILDVGVVSSAVVLRDYSATGAPQLPAGGYPAAGGYYVDPEFGTKIIRVTDNINSTDVNRLPGSLNPTYDGPCLNTYSTWSAFNADDSRFMIECGTSVANLKALVYNFDTSTDSPSFFDSLDTGLPFNVQPEGAVWSSSSPDIAYALGSPVGTTSQRILYKIDVTKTSSATDGTGRFTPIHDFTNDSVFNITKYTTTHPEWSVCRLTKSDDDTTFALVTREHDCTAPDWSDAIVYNTHDGTSMFTIPDSAFVVKTADVSKSGTNIVIPNATPGATGDPDVWDGATAFWVVDCTSMGCTINGTPNRADWGATGESGGHFDSGSTLLVGHETYSGHSLLKRDYNNVNAPINFLTFEKMSGGQLVYNGCLADHVSFRDDAGTLAAISTYWESNCLADNCGNCSIDYSVPFTNEIFLAEVGPDVTETWYRLAHTRSNKTHCDPNTQSGCYETQTRASIDNFGHYIIFHTDLGASNPTDLAGLYDVFILKIPTDLWPGCGAGTTACNNTCVDTETNASNCGSCGYVCRSGDTCVNGDCTGACVTPCGDGCCDASHYCGRFKGVGDYTCLRLKSDASSCTDDSECLDGCCGEGSCGYPPMCPGGGGT